MVLIRNLLRFIENHEINFFRKIQGKGSIFKPFCENAQMDVSLIFGSLSERIYAPEIVLPSGRDTQHSAP